MDYLPVISLVVKGLEGKQEYHFTSGMGAPFLFRCYFDWNTAFNQTIDVRSFSCQCNGRSFP